MTNLEKISNLKKLRKLGQLSAIHPNGLLRPGRGQVQTATDRSMWWLAQLEPELARHSTEMLDIARSEPFDEGRYLQLQALVRADLAHALFWAKSLHKRFLGPVICLVDTPRIQVTTQDRQAPTQSGQVQALGPYPVVQGLVRLQGLYEALLASQAQTGEPGVQPKAGH